MGVPDLPMYGAGASRTEVVGVASGRLRVPFAECTRCRRTAPAIAVYDRSDRWAEQREHFRRGLIALAIAKGGTFAIARHHPDIDGPAVLETVRGGLRSQRLRYITRAGAVRDV